MVEEVKEVEVDPLKGLYYARIDELVKESEVIQRDITGEFYAFIQDKIDNDELINIAIKGEVSGSKSTSAISIVQDINDIISVKLNKKIDMFQHIFSDQTEFIRFISTEETNVGVVIDEFSRIAQTGFNATTEVAQYDHYSDVFAQKFIHRISCSPAIVADMNANVVLEYIGKNVPEKVSKFILRYKNASRGLQEWTLGCIYVDVSNILDKKYYQRYRKKKFDRMALLDKYGVRDIRELEFADTTLEVVDELKDFVADGNKQELSDMILAIISKVNRNRKRIYSMLTVGEIASRCRNMLNLYSTVGRIMVKIDKSKSDVERSQMFKKVRKIKEILDREVNEQQKRREIYKDYLNI